MSLWDWAQAGIGIADTSIDDYKGSYKVTAGTALSAYFGGRHTHIYGPEVKFVCDPEDVLGQLLPPWLMAGASGLTSNATFVYGSSTSATYIGPKVDIQRAPKISRVSKKFVTKPGVGNAGTWTENEEADALDKASAAAVAVLSLLALATAASLELAMYIHYRQFTDSSSGPGPESKSMAVASYAIPSRLMAIMKVVETSACYGSWAEVSMIKATGVAGWEATAAGCRNLIERMQAAYIEWQERRAAAALAAAEEAVEEVAEDE
jgi:hypothetical protein